MKEQAVLLIHGMGEFTPPSDKKPGAFGQEFIDATSAVLDGFKNHKGDELSNYVDVHEFNYDAWFEKMRNIFADRAKAMDERITTAKAKFGFSFPAQIAASLNSWEQKFGDDDFFHTHLLDVLFYGTILGAKIRVDAGLAITSLISEYGNGNVHIIAHSLGTAVAHDTVHLLYRHESDPNDEVPDLDPANAQLGSVWMFANVSRLTNKVVPVFDPYASIVRPGPTGCTGAFFNIRHQLDPFTWLAQFDPSNDGRWVNEEIYATRYHNVVTDLVFDANTHSFPRYVRDPKVVLQMIPFLLGDDFKTDLAEIKEVAATYAKGSVQGAFAAMEDSLRDLPANLETISGWENFLRTGQAFSEAMKHLKDTFPAIS